VHAQGTVQVYDRSIINYTLFEFHCAFSAVSRLLIGGIFLKIHTSHSLRLRYKRCKFVCIQASVQRRAVVLFGCNNYRTSGPKNMTFVTLHAEYITRDSVLPVTCNADTSEECLPRGQIGVSGRHNTPAALPQGKSPSTHCTERWVDDSADLGG